MPWFTISKAILLVFIIWFVIMLYISGLLVKVQKPNTSIEDGFILKRMNQVHIDIDLLARQNRAFKKLLLIGHYSPDHEQLRRKIENDIQELYLFTSARLTDLKLTSDRRTFDEHFHSLLADSQRLAEIDNAAVWRREKLANLTLIVQQRLFALQNPDNCYKAKKLVCSLNKGCGFGCQLHHVAYCLMMAFGTGRMMLLVKNGKEWRYSSNGWEAVFRPVSEKCFYNNRIKSQEQVWHSLASSSLHPVVSLPIIDSIFEKPNFLPQSIPAEFAPDLLHLHGSPSVWFAGQFVSYLMRPAGHLNDRIESIVRTIQFATDPIVGIQVRRSDKIGTEASFHHLEEYILWAERWFSIQSVKFGRQLPRRLFIATDDPKVVDQVRAKYSHMEIHADSSVASSAQIGRRYLDNSGSLLGVISDIELLSRCDYLVCTFSSQVCRVAYELMQVRRGDAAFNFHSLDDFYYYGGQHAHEQVVTMNHTAENQVEIDLQVGDVVGVAGNHWNGYSNGQNRRTGKKGLYPSFKVREKWRIAEFPLLRQKITH